MSGAPRACRPWAHAAGLSASLGTDGRRRASATRRSLSFSPLSLWVVASNLSSIVLFPWPSSSALSLSIQGKAIKQSLIGGEAEHWGSGAATSELDLGCNGARKDNDFVVVRDSTVTSSCGCRDLRRLELPASTAVCLEVYAAAEGQHPLGGSASSSGGSCGGGAGRPGYPAASLA
jgi:hypothetical protein